MSTKDILLIKVLCFTGAQGTGKSTMRRALVNYIERFDNKIIDRYSGVPDSISRMAAGIGFKINEETDFMTQYYIAVKYIAHDLETRKRAQIYGYDYIVLDRSVLDSIPYVVAADNITHGEKKLIKELLFNHFQMYPAVLIHCEPLNIIKPDGTRSISKVFQRKVYNNFVEMLSIVQKKNNKVFNLINEPTDDRMSKLKGFLNLGSIRVQ